jgi:hypothetical protein
MGGLLLSRWQKFCCFLRKGKVALKILRVFVYIFIPGGFLQGNTQIHYTLKRRMIQDWKEDFWVF